MKLPHPRRRRRPDGRDPHPANFPRVVEDFVKHLEECVHAVRTREDHPIVAVRVLHELAELEQILRRLDADRRQLKDIRPQRAQPAAQHARLLPRARDHDALAKKRPRLKPVQRIPQLHHIAENRHRRRFETRRLHFRRDVPQRPAQRVLPPGRAPAHQRHGRRRRRAVLTQFRRDRADPLHAHEHHLRPRRRRELREIERAFRLRGILVSGENRKLRRVVAMRHRDARVRRRRQRRGHPWNNLKPQPRFRQRLRLLPTAPEQKRIATFQPHHPLPRPRFLHQPLLDFLLPQSMRARFFPRVNDLRIRRCPAQNLRVAQVVINDHLRTLHDLLHPQRDQPEIARSGSGEIADSFGFFRGFFHKRGVTLEPPRTPAKRAFLRRRLTSAESPRASP